MSDALFIVGFAFLMLAIMSPFIAGDYFNHKEEMAKIARGCYDAGEEEDEDEDEDDES